MVIFYSEFKEGLSSFLNSATKINALLSNPATLPHNPPP